jgi:hypothetical protein
MYALLTGLNPLYELKENKKFKVGTANHGIFVWHFFTETSLLGNPLFVA